MPYLKPARDQDSHNVINMNTPLSGATVYRGTIVKFIGSGINLQDANTLVNLTPPVSLINSSAYGSYQAFFGAPTGGLLVPAASGEEYIACGVTVFDQLTYDEYQTYLLYNGARAVQMDVVITGQSMPFSQEGLFLYSGIAGTPAAGSGVAISDTVAGEVKVVGPAVLPRIGKFLGPKDANGFALIAFDFWS